MIDLLTMQIPVWTIMPVVFFVVFIVKWPKRAVFYARKIKDRVVRFFGDLFGSE